MIEASLGARARWTISVVVATIVVALLLALFRFPSPPVLLPVAVNAPTTKSPVQIARPDESDALLREQAELRDLRPLFLPTALNAALPEPRMESSPSLLESDTLKLVLADDEAQLSKELPPAALIARKRVPDASPLDAIGMLETGFNAPGFGRRSANLAPLGPRAGEVWVFSHATGREVLRTTLAAEAAPPGGKSWAPIEFVAAVDAAGLVSPLVVTEGSGVEEVDVFFRNYLAGAFRLGERILPGLYRIIVAP